MARPTIAAAPEAMPAQIPEPPLARLVFAATPLAWFWLLVRVYCGYQWIEAGWAKLQNPAQARRTGS